MPDVQIEGLRAFAQSRLSVRSGMDCGCYQWKGGWVAYGLNGQINVQRWPKEVVFSRPLNLAKLLDCGTPKPREVSKGQKQLFVGKQQPEAVF